MDGVPRAWRGGSNPLAGTGERFIPGDGYGFHAEANIMDAVGRNPQRYRLLGMASSTYMCGERLARARGLGLVPQQAGSGRGSPALHAI